LLVVLTLNLALVAALVIVGAAAHSLAVLAEGGDYLLDAAGIGVALLALRLSARRIGGGGPQRHPDATSIAALVNAGWLLALELLVAFAALERLVTGTTTVDGLPVLVVSGTAALVMSSDDTAGAQIVGMSRKGTHRSPGADGGHYSPATQAEESGVNPHHRSPLCPVCRTRRKA